MLRISHETHAEYKNYCKQKRLARSRNILFPPIFRQPKLFNGAPSPLAVHTVTYFSSIRLNYSCTFADAIRPCIFQTLYRKDS